MSRKEFEIPDIDYSDPKVKAVLGNAPIEGTNISAKATKKKIVPIHLEDEEVEHFNTAYSSSTSKSERDFAKSIILDKIKPIVKMA